MPSLDLIIWPLIGYLFGSISSAILISKLFGLNDPRQQGSKNPGATNVLRSGNKFAAALTLFGDVLKGAIPVALAQYYGAPTAIIAVVCITAFMGHLYPIFFGFKGGKGVATAIGVFMALSWKIFSIFALVWLLVLAISRYSSLSALIAAAITGLASFAVLNQAHQVQLIGAVFWIVAFLFLRHRENIEKLRAGKESKVGSKK